MDLRGLQETWEHLAREDPLGAILEPFRGRRDDDLAEFFALGELEIDGVLEGSRRFGLPSAHRSALDFGCGAGRLTQAMARHFDECIGVDIAPSMIELAKRLNRHPDRCRYELNETDSLAAFADASFDLVYSNITLQHIAPKLSRRYIAEFVRVLRPRGLLVFQLPSERETASYIPWSAMRAEVEPHERELTLAASERRIIRVRARNSSDTVWPAGLERRSIRLGNHWRERGGRLLQMDDGRTDLPRDAAPGDVLELTLEVTAPPRAGEYLLEIDVVQEGVAWFADRGSPPARIPVVVEGDLARAAAAPEVAEHRPLPAPPATRRRRRRLRARAGGLVRRLAHPRAQADEGPGYEMHGIPRDEVLSLLEASGGEVVEVTENDSAGPGWISLRYVVTKAGR